MKLLNFCFFIHEFIHLFNLTSDKEDAGGGRLHDVQLPAHGRLPGLRPRDSPRRHGAPARPVPRQDYLSGRQLRWILS